MEEQILKSFSKDYKFIGRDQDGDIYLLNDESNEEIILDGYNDLFKNIKSGDLIKIKEYKL